MVRMVPVVETRGDDCPFWGVEPSGWSYVEVPPASGGRFGTVVWALVGGTEGIGEAGDAADAIEVFLAIQDDEYIVQGGVRVIADGAVIDPGWCAGLEEWRDWTAAVRGHAVGFGHDPDVWVERHGESWRVWEDTTGHAAPSPDARYVELPADALPDLLQGVRRDLLGFLDALGEWARATVPAHAGRLVEAVDRRLVISPPLDL